MDIAAFIMGISMFGTAAGLISNFIEWQFESSRYGQSVMPEAAIASAATERSAPVQVFDRSMPMPV